MILICNLCYRPLVHNYALYFYKTGSHLAWVLGAVMSLLDTSHTYHQTLSQAVNSGDIRSLDRVNRVSMITSSVNQALGRDNQTNCESQT